ncbi:MAG: DUF1989 domain-containing protein [Burkholderiales bacterium]|jgi:hypothetical protein|nr:DUF1989 domain-containing protein [Burkholderiales bacterium]
MTPTDPKHVESALDPATAVWDVICPAGEPWTRTLLRGQTLRIHDLEGQQAVDTLFYAAHDIEERYSAVDTIQHQAALYLGVGTVLMSTEGRPMLEIVADTCGRHDTLGGACAQESNTVRYALDKRHMHACRCNFVSALAQHDAFDAGKRDITHNINFFMNVPVTPDGTLVFADGIGRPGAYVELRACMDVIVVISNCPQLNNPCNGWNPTPVRLIAWDPA